MKTPILGTGLSGLVGSRLGEILASRFDFEDISYETGVDITDKEAVKDRIQQSKSKWIIHLAAKTDVDGCEKDKLLGNKGQAWKINVEGTRNICEAAEKSRKKVLFISTDFVFTGTKDSYDEQDLPMPINWYGVTKFEAEKIVLENSNNLVVRIAYPYRAKCTNKMDFVHQIIQKLTHHGKVQVLTDHIFTPTFIDDIAIAIDKLVTMDEIGIYHVVGSQPLTPYEVAQTLAYNMNLDKSLIMPITINEYYKNRAKRPYKLYLKNVKIKSLDVPMRTFLDGLKEINIQGVE